jgi:electron transport complex protein RnfD
MATDMVTTPVTGKGMFIFGLGCGIITMIIRRWGGYPEGVSFSILIMNSLTPLINRFTRPRVFGHIRKEKRT